ncbi:MAG: diguanylate cyclase [Candidatus Omnitrophica bacterium]|nr:diguanylate cyclase [Candidatus Omnitrophota bacterium]
MDILSVEDKCSQILPMLVQALEQTDDHVMITNKDGVIEYVNHSFEHTTGYSRQDVLGQNPKILKSGQHPLQYYQELWGTILSGQVFHAQTIDKKRTCEFFIADQSISPVRGLDGQVMYFVSVWKDVTERMAMQEKLKSLNAQLADEKNKLEQVLSLEASLHHISDLHKLIDFVIERTCRILEVRKCSIMFVDEASGELCIRGHQGIDESRIGVHLLRLGDQMEDLIELHRTSGSPGGFGKNHGSLKIDGAVYQSDLFLSVPIKMGGRLLGMMNVSDKKASNRTFSDLDLSMLSLITRQTKAAIENARLYQNVKYLTVTDALTGVYNYHYFIQTLDYELVRVKRYGRDLSLLMVDVDQFKAYNDALGYHEGDKVLKSIAEVLKENMRQTDVICRYGEDEFIMILPDTDAQKAKIAAEKIRKKVMERPFFRLITVSIGAAQCSANTDRHSLVRRVDNALYAAKSQGRNRVFG